MRTLFCLAALAVLFQADAGSDVRKDVTILFTNDAHTHVDNRNGRGLRYSQVAKLKQDCAKDGPVFLVDAGDYLQGTAYGILESGGRIVGLMNAAGYDVATVGNHEFDFHATNLASRVREAKFPIVSCNVWRRDAATGDRVRAFASYAVLTNRGVSVAFVGLTTPDTVRSESPGCFLDPTGRRQGWGLRGYPVSAADELYAAVQEAVDEARRWAPDYVVLLGHAGALDELKPYRSADIIAHTVGCDCFIDGHSHTEQSLAVVTNKAGKGVAVAQAGSFLAAVGRMKLARSEAVRSELVRRVDGRDAEVVRLEDELIRDVEGYLSEKLADLAFDMPAKSPADGTWLVRTHATAIGDLEADAFYWYANGKGDAAHAADVAIVHGGGIRDGFRAGALTLKEAVSVNPFLNEMLVAEMPGRTLVEALEWGARKAPSASNSTLLHVAGLRYSVATNCPPLRRVCDVTVYDRKDGIWKPLDPSRTYRVAGMDFLLRSGGSGFTMLTNAVPVGFYGGMELDARQFADYLKSFRGGKVSSSSSPLFERGYAETLSYENSFGGERILFVTEASAKIAPRLGR